MDGVGPSERGPSLSFVVPTSLEAHEPPEARGVARDGVRLLVSSARAGAVVHTTFARLPDFLRAGDVVVVNTSATINAALPAERAGGAAVELRLSQRLADGRWVVELRQPGTGGTEPLRTAAAGERIALPAGGSAMLIAPYLPSRPLGRVSTPGGTRLWSAKLELAGDLMSYLDRHGAPIRYGYVPEAWPLDCYRTMFAREPGSAEMPSAGRAFTPRTVAALEGKGIALAPILLHTGVSSLEAEEPPYPERYRVGLETARAVNDARRRGGRVVAVGTTAVRALESAASPDGTLAAREGWTDLVITAERGLRVVDALLTGFHEPRASHLAMLEALAGRRHLQVAYDAALRGRYLWHEFGDLHLILP